MRLFVLPVNKIIFHWIPGQEKERAREREREASWLLTTSLAFRSFVRSFARPPFFLPRAWARAGTHLVLGRPRNLYAREAKVPYAYIVAFLKEWQREKRIIKFDIVSNNLMSYIINPIEDWNPL